MRDPLFAIVTLALLGISAQLAGIHTNLREIRIANEKWHTIADDRLSKIQERIELRRCRCLESVK